MLKIYLDYAATTPLDPKVLKAMTPYLKKDFGNASSIHGFGQKALSAIDEARASLAGFLNCSTEEVYFTGSATEANNLALQGLIKALAEKGKKPHIITSCVEHHAISETAEELKQEGAEVTYLPVDKEGIVSLPDLKKAIKDNTVLVSIIYANNEIGTVQPITEIANIIGNFRNSKTQIPNSKIYFHTDAVQAANYLDCDVENLGVDLLTLSGHKIYGPKGVGALYVRKGTPIKPLIFGGGQEQGLRSGTENVPGIVGLGAAVKEIQNQKIKIQNIKIKQLRDKIIKQVPKIIPNMELNGSAVQRLPNNVNFSFEGVEGEALVVALDQKGVAVSTGSACSSRTLEASHVLLALGLSEEKAHNSLRISLGRYTTEKEVDKFLKVLPLIVARLREISGYKNKKNA